MKRAGTSLLALFVTLAWARGARAGGYDTPILYSARHMGMGGTAISFVDDPSALFHNPAGLAYTGFIAVTANVSPVFGTLKGSPRTPNQDIESELTFAPFFLIGASFRVTDFLTLGIAGYPVASAGGTYKYSFLNKDWTDETKLAFFEITPGLAFNLPGNFNIGLGYRISIVTLDRLQKADQDPTGTFDFSLKGASYLGFRGGIQWQPFDWLQIGMVYRHKTETEVTADSGRAFHEYRDIEADFILPSKLGMGARVDIGDTALAVDVELTFNSQNQSTTLKGTRTLEKDGVQVEQEDEIVNQFRWKDEVTVRLGFQHRFLQRWLVRAGYIFDGETTNERHPTAFGTPPAPTHVATLGFGYDHGPFEVNLAYAHRFGTANVRKSEIDAGTADLGSCLTCSFAGTYEMKLHGLYLDFSYYFGGKRKRQ